MMLCKYDVYNKFTANSALEVLSSKISKHVSPKVIFKNYEFLYEIFNNVTLLEKCLKVTQCYQFSLCLEGF